MALDPRKRIKKLLQRRAKRKAKASSEKHTQQGKPSWLGSLMLKGFEMLARAPVYECYVANEIFQDDQGIGQVVVSRYSGSGLVAAGVFLIDAYCLGVKDAFALLKPRAEYEQMLDGMRQAVTLRRVEPAYAKKLVVGAIAYARNLGFEPHEDYELPSKVLADIDETACQTEFTFGQDGKPLFIAGPNDTPERCQQVIDTLHRRFGPEGYHFMMPVSPFGAFFDDDDDDDDWEDEDDDEEWEDDDEEWEDDDEDEDERRRRI